MTDEEKAEVIDTFIRIGEEFLKGNKHFHLESILARDTIQAVKELQKENKICEEIIIGEQVEIDRLNKENEQLKAQIQEQQIIAMQRIADKELKIVNLEEQIEKMKCCENCKHYSISAEEVCEDCNFFGIPNAMNDKWEIAE